MIARRIAAILAIAISLFGCSAATTTKTVPEQLVGVWNTGAQKYADRYFELKKDAVIFALGAGKVSQSTVLQVKESREKTQSLYEISYLSQEGTTEKFTIYYEPATSTIRIKSQGKMEWKRGEVGARLAQAAANIPAGVAHTEAQQRPPEPAKPSKQPESVTPRIALAVKPDESTTPRRDPFLSPIKPAPRAAQPTILPPGKRGILISQAKLQGVAKAVNGMVAVVSGLKGQIYFLHPNDIVYNGRVARITIDSIVFEETSIDPNGKSITREIVKKLGAAE